MFVPEGKLAGEVVSKRWVPGNGNWRRSCLSMMIDESATKSL